MSPGDKTFQREREGGREGERVCVCVVPVTPMIIQAGMVTAATAMPFACMYCDVARPPTVHPQPYYYVLKEESHTLGPFTKVGRLGYMANNLSIPHSASVRIHLGNWGMLEMVVG